MLNNIRTFLFVKEPPYGFVLFVMLVTGIASVGTSYFLEEQRYAERNKVSEMTVDYRSFRTETDKFAIQFGAFAYHIMRNGELSDAPRIAVMESLTEQHQKLDHLKVYLNEPERYLVVDFQSQLYKLLNIVRATSSPEELGEAYESVAVLLDKREDLFELMEARTGISG